MTRPKTSANGPPAVSTSTCTRKPTAKAAAVLEEEEESSGSEDVPQVHSFTQKNSDRLYDDDDGGGF